MNAINEQQIESLLRLSPQPLPPPGMKERLLAQVKPAPSRYPSSSPAISHAPDGWLRRWWPALGPAMLGLACAAVLTVQQIRIHELRQNIDSLSARAIAESNAAGRPNIGTNVDAAAADTAAKEAEEIARLKETVRTLTGEIKQLDQMRLENQSLRAKLSALPAAFSVEEAAEIQKARDGAMRIACINNMKQLGLAARLWAGDNMDHYPPDIICMSNELSTPKILVCPADTGREAAANFGSFTPANCSYEWFLAPPGSEAEPTRVLTRCPIHGSVGCYDGSVQSAGKDHPEWFVQRDGKLYFEPPAQR